MLALPAARRNIVGVVAVVVVVAVVYAVHRMEGSISIH